MREFEDKTALVTGAGRGIGEAIAGALAARGARVVVVDRDADAARAAADRIGAAGGAAEARPGDVLDAAFLDEIVREADAAWGGVGILVNNAGVIRDNLLENVTEEDWDTVLGVNLKGAFLCARAVVPGMKARGSGRIVNIASRAWLGNVGQANYSASKGGLVSLTRTLALELARHGVTVNAVAPGLIDTPMTRGLPERVRERLIRAQPTRSMGTVEDVAEAVCFLASDRARFITGQVLHVDGGKSVGLLSV